MAGAEAVYPGGRLFRRVTSVSIRAKLMGMALGLVLLVGLAVTMTVRVRLAADLSYSLEERGVAITRDLAARAADLVLTDNTFALYQLIRDTLENNPDVRYVFVLDAAGRPLVHSFPQSVPPDLLSANQPEAAEPDRLQHFDSDEGSMIDVAVPILAGRAGVAHVGLSEARLEAAVTRVTWELLGITALALLLGTAIALSLTHWLTSPVLELVEVTRRVGEGDLQARARPFMADEIGELALAFNHMAASLETSHEAVKEKEALRGQLLERIIAVQEAERQRLARELHDEAGQVLTSLSLGLRSLQETPGLNAAQSNLAQDMKALSTRLMTELHRLAVELRPSALDRVGLVAALEQYTHEFGRRYALDAEFEAAGLSPVGLPSGMEIHIYRMVQEALTNVARHAQARHVAIILQAREATLVITVEDDGCGFDPTQVEKGRLGLFGMQERATLLGGSFSVESAPNRGTTVFIRVPLPMVAAPVTATQEVELVTH
jgi:signal transduction histidine kinase